MNLKSLWQFVLYFYHLIMEMGANGKLFIAWALQEFAPFLAGYPGVLDAANAYLADPSSKNLMLLGFHVFYTSAAGHRLLKVMVEAWRRLQRKTKIVPPLKH